MDGKYCPKCGKMNNFDDVFCGNCGTKLPAGTVPQNVPQQQAAAPQNNPHRPAAAPQTGLQQPVAAQNMYADAAPAGNGEEGKGAATASMILGILAVVCWFFGYSSILSVLFGLIGLILAGSAKKAGYQGGMRTAGFVLSLIGMIGGALVLIACVACVGSLGLGLLGSSF